MDWARLLGVQAMGRRWRARSVMGTRKVRRRACVGARERAQAWALGAGKSARGAQSAGRRASERRRGGARARAGSGTAGRAGARAAGRQARARQGSRRGRAGRWAWARGALGVGALGVGARGARPGRGLGARPGRLGWPWAVHSVHSAHFRSVLTRFFFPESPNEHRSL